MVFPRAKPALAGRFCPLGRNKTQEFRNMEPDSSGAQDSTDECTLWDAVDFTNTTKEKRCVRGDMEKQE